MKFVITSKNTGSNYLIDTDQDEIHAALERFIHENPNCIFLKREFREDEDALELFKISTEKIK
jgi:hypothetical protein